MEWLGHAHNEAMRAARKELAALDANAPANLDVCEIVGRALSAYANMDDRFAAAMRDTMDALSDAEFRVVAETSGRRSTTEWARETFGRDASDVCGDAAGEEPFGSASAFQMPR